MTVQNYEVIVRTSGQPEVGEGITIRELGRLCQCQPALLRRLLDIGLLEPISVVGVPLFGRSAVLRVRKALRLRRDLRLNMDALALVMELLDRIHELELRMG